MEAIPQKSPCACSLERRPPLTQLIELRLGLSEGAALQAEPLAMRSKTLSFLLQVLGRGLTHGIQELGVCRWPGEELPGALALERPLRLALLARGPEQAAPRLTKATFACVVCPRHAQHGITGAPPRPRAPADRVEVTAKHLEQRCDIGSPSHCVERAAELPSNVGRAHGQRGSGF